MSNLDKIYLWKGQVILLGNDGTPFTPAQPPSTCYVTYASKESDLPTAFSAHQSAGANPSKRLFLLTQPETSARRVGLLYTFEGDRYMPVRDGGMTRQNQLAVAFNVIHGPGSYEWERDYTAGTPGLFITGPSSYGNVFRLERIEYDPVGRSVLTIQPLRTTTTGVPKVNLSGVLDVALRREAEQHYRELHAAFDSASSLTLVERITSLVEGCLTDRLRTKGISAPQSLSKMLEVCKQRLDSGQRALLDGAGYHAAHTIRLAHQRTHPEAAARKSMPIEPEEALALLQDLKRVLGALGLLRK